jgi:RimJ/RimL family protein N-acetyltransferase
MTRALTVLSRWVLETQGFIRVEVRVAAENTASARVATGAAFTREGVLRQAGHTHAGPVDLIVYSLLRSDLGEPKP